MVRYVTAAPQDVPVCGGSGSGSGSGGGGSGDGSDAATQSRAICIWASCHFWFWSVVDHAMPCYSMKMEVPGLADSLQQCLCVSSGIYAGDVLTTDPGWQQSKLRWALSAEVGSASRMHCTGLSHDKAARQPFREIFHRHQT